VDIRVPHIIRCLIISKVYFPPTNFIIKTLKLLIWKLFPKQFRKWNLISSRVNYEYTRSECTHNWLKYNFLQSYVNSVWYYRYNCIQQYMHSLLYIIKCTPRNYPFESWYFNFLDAYGVRLFTSFLQLCFYFLSNYK